VAARRLLGAGRSVAAFAIVVDTKDEHAVLSMKSSAPSRFRSGLPFLLTSTAAEAFAGAAD